MDGQDVKMNAVAANYPLPFVRRLLYPMTNRMGYENWEQKNRLYKLIVGDSSQCNMQLRNLRCQFYAPQTKILEGRTNVSECVFEALFIL
jgi:hypothetical protein